MATTFTSVFGMAKPATGEANDSWGTLYNNNLDTIDEAMYDGAGHGECILQELSATQCRLFPMNGNRIKIAGVVREIPAAGITHTYSGMVADNNYYVYAYYSGSQILLETSLTSYTETSSFPGVVVKFGDSTRTLVGLVRSRSGTQIYDQATYPHVLGLLSWFNRRPKRIYINNTVATALGTPQTIPAQLWASAWAGDQVHFHLEGHVTVSTAFATGVATGRINGVNTSWPPHATPSVAGGYAPFSIDMNRYATNESMIGMDFTYYVNGGTGTWGYVAYCQIMG